MGDTNGKDGAAAGDDEPHILLFFDVNKTVIMHDPVQGKGLHHILNDLLTERAFGAVDADGAAWAWNGQSVLDDIGDPSGSSEVSYGAFLRSKYPMSSDPTQAKHHKKMRKLLRQDFTAPGNPGAAFAHEHAILLEKLRLPSHDAADPRVVAAGLDESPYHFMVPAFFRLMQFLHERGTKFNLIFRTYGDDLHRIAQEFNLFCSGQHPFFSPGSTLMDGSDGSIDRRLHLSTEGQPHRHGTFYRSDSTTALVMGTFLQPKDTQNDHAEYYKDVHGVEIVDGMNRIHAFLTAQWRANQATLALRDFYPHWFTNREDASAGKLMTVDTADESVHAVFFDDNILAHESHIVDARSYPDGQPLEWEKVRDVHLMRVEPLDAVRDDRYFINRFLSSLDHRSKTKTEKVTEK